MACTVTPTLTCIEDLGANSYLAHFGYTSTCIVSLGLSGANNFFTPAPANRGQPILFLLGTFTNVFSVAFTGPSLTWTLINNGTHTVTATAASTICSGTGGCTPGQSRDCAGTCGGTATLDCANHCCGGTSGSTCAPVDCAGVCNGTSTKDCAGVCNGAALKDCSATCCGGTTVVTCLVPDCAGVCNGTTIRDCANVCGGHALRDCANVCNGTGTPDCAGTCNGTGTFDCAGICNGNSYRDCGGNCIVPSLCPAPVPIATELLPKSIAQSYIEEKVAHIGRSYWPN
jgi:hypothetical protein